MISAASTARVSSPRRPLRACEPADPFSRGGLVALRWRKGNPCADHTSIRVSQRLAAGMPVSAVARAERTDEAASDRLLQRDGFVGLIESWRELAALPAADYTAQMARLARLAIHNALEDWDVGVACFVLREHGWGRDPAATLASRLAATTRRTTAPPAPAAATPPPAAPSPAAPSPAALSPTALSPTALSPAATPAPGPRAYDPLDALVHRQTAALRQAVLAEHAIQATATAATRTTGAAATIAAARQALALRRAAEAATAAHTTEPRHGLAAPARATDRLSTAHARAVPSPARRPHRPRAP